MLFLDWVQGNCFGFDVTIFLKNSPLPFIKFQVILIDTRTEMVSVNNLLKQTGTVYRMNLQFPFTISASSFICPAGKY